MVNGFQIGVTDRDILVRTQRSVPADCRHHVVLVEFEEPIDKRRAQDFYRIGLTEDHLSKGENDQGEDSFYQAEIFQPHRCGPKFCGSCRQMNDRRSLTISLCRNPRCALVGREVADGPVRGVIRVDCPADFIVGTKLVNPITRKGRILAQQMEIVLTRGVLLVLDRRYDDSVVAAVWRTAKAMGEINGLKVKG